MGVEAPPPPPRRSPVPHPLRHSPARSGAKGPAELTPIDFTLKPGWQWIELEDARRALWSVATGRHFAVPKGILTGSIPPVIQARLDDLGHLGADLSARIPCRRAWALLLPARLQLWHACPRARGPGGVPWKAADLAPEELFVLGAIDHRRTIRQIARDCRLTDEAVLSVLRRFTTPEVQAFELRRRAPRPHDFGLTRLVLPPRPVNTRRDDQYTASGATSLSDWHIDGITDAAVHFDDVETTFAHAFAQPHAALGYQPYGARLYDQLIARDLIAEEAHVLEVGPGTGQLARDFIDRDARAVPHRRIARYTRLDRSPVLLKAQNALVPSSVGIEGDAAAVPLSDASLDLVLSNEVLADLPAVPLSDPEVAIRVGRYGLTALPAGAWFNLGAWKLVEEAWRLLKPGGTVVLTEFGDVDEVPTETTHLDHPEVSIHFGHLLDVARGVGLEAELVPLSALLNIDLHARWLSRASFEGMRALHRAEGAHLEARAWTTASVPKPVEVLGLDDVVITADGAAPVVTRIWALVARKPA